MGQPQFLHVVVVLERKTRERCVCVFEILEPRVSLLLGKGSTL